IFISETSSPNICCMASALCGSISARSSRLVTSVTEPASSMDSHICSSISDKAGGFSMSGPNRPAQPVSASNDAEAVPVNAIRMPVFMKFSPLCIYLHRVFEISAHFDRRGHVERTTDSRDLRYFKVAFIKSLNTLDDQSGQWKHQCNNNKATAGQHIRAPFDDDAGTCQLVMP